MWCILVVLCGRECQQVAVPTRRVAPLLERVGRGSRWGNTQYMFLGEFTHTLDPKGRLTIPARFRAQLADGLVISRGQDACLVIYPVREWEALAEALGRLPRSSQGARSYNRLMFSGACEATLDRMGRVLVPPFLRSHAGIHEDVVIVGANKVIEVWNPQAWQETLAANLAEMETILGAVGQLGV